MKLLWRIPRLQDKAFRCFGKFFSFFPTEEIIASFLTTIDELMKDHKKQLLSLRVVVNEKIDFADADRSSIN